MREQMRLTLSPEKTHITHVDDGFDLLGFRVKRLPQRRIPVAYSFPSERSFRDIKHRIKELTGRSNVGLSLDELFHSLNPILRDWTNYHRHAASKRCFSYLDHFLWWRVMLWLRKKHPRLTWKQIRRRYWGRRWTSPDGTRLYCPGQVPVTHYRYRGHRIPTPWAPPTEPRPPPGQKQALLELHHEIDQRLTLWSAGCVGTRTSGAEGGASKPPRKRGMAARLRPYVEIVR